jgi:phage terminase Nu1 subunit (DNA packaging protein)
MSITLWKPEPDVLIHQALGKACEEASELANILARCLIQGLNESEPVSGKRNRQALFEEIADLDAAVQWLRELVNDEYDGDRADRKLNGFRRWQCMLEADLAATSTGGTE